MHENESTTVLLHQWLDVEINAAFDFARNLQHPTQKKNKEKIPTQNVREVESNLRFCQVYNVDDIIYYMIL